MRTKLLTLMLALLVSSAAYANHYSDFYVLPVATHTAGANNTMWMSDIAIYNFQPVTIVVELVLVESGEATVDNIESIMSTMAPNGSATIPAGASVLLKDILGGQRAGAPISGAILIGSDRPFAVTSRTYNQLADGQTYGQTVPPARNFLENTVGSVDPATNVAYVPGIISNTRFRTNLGMVAANASGDAETMNVAITMRDASGAVAGARNFAVAPGGLIHVQISARSLSASNIDVGSAEFRITSGSGAVVPYASVIDNVTGDAVFVTGEFPEATGVFANSWRRSPFREALERARPAVQ